jgi:hypothetical protein
MLFFRHPTQWWRDYPDGTRFGDDVMREYYAPIEDEL